MPERTSYSHGTPNWVDLQTPEPAAAKEFYTGVFGWDYLDFPMPTGPVYSMATLRGEPVAAISPQPPEMAASGAPPTWNTYLAVDSVDEAAARAAAAGGQVAVGPMDVLDSGRLSFVIDPGGAAIGLWQAGTHIGARIVNEPGTLIWNELITTAPVTAFYEQVAGLTTETMNMGQGDYTVFKVGDTQIGGTVGPYVPGTPNHWHVYFAVTSADDTAATATKLGGTIVAEPFDSPVGRIAVVRDPQGAVFSIIAPRPPQQS